MFYGAQHLAHKYGGEVLPSNSKWSCNLSFVDDLLIKGIPIGSWVWMMGVLFLASEDTKLLLLHDVDRAGYILKMSTMRFSFIRIYHSTDGKILLKNFLVDLWLLSGWIQHLLLKKQ